MTGFKLAGRDHIDDTPAGVLTVLDALGHTEALVTDLSTVGDFCLAGMFGLTVEDYPELKKLEAIVGRPVKMTDLIYELGKEIEAKL